MSPLDAQSNVWSNAQSNIWPIIVAWGEGSAPSSCEWQKLIDWELSSKVGNRSPAAVWKTGAEDVRAALLERAQILQTLESRRAVLPLPGSWQAHVELLWTFWLPLAQQISDRQAKLGRPFIQGILGGQGSGKTTLTKGLSVILQLMGKSAAALSLDDLYLPYRDRLKLQQADARLAWRGPPGTHDVGLGIRTLSAVKSAALATQISLPRFDKSLHRGQGDRIAPVCQPVPSILFFEGWFVGARPLDDALFADSRIKLPSPIETTEDRLFARDMNRQLRHYQPLWALLDSLLVILLEDYRLSYEWRLQAERDMHAAGKECLSDREIASFVTYFWKALHPELFIVPIAERAIRQRDNAMSEQQPADLPIDLVVEIGQGHTVKALRSPQ